MSPDRPQRIITILAVVILGAVGVVANGSILLGGVAWLGFLFFVLSGWGFLVMRAAKRSDPEFGMRAMWGACGYLAVAGVFLAANILSRSTVLGLIAIGVAGFAWRELTAPVASWSGFVTVARRTFERPALAWFTVVLIGIAVVRIVGAVTTLERNPWDDDIAYTPMLKRLLDCGDLIEPFSFRRLGAYGGQTVLHALGGARGSLDSVHLIDKGLCFGLALLLFVGHARAVRTQPVWTVIVALVVLLMPDTAVNTASYWSGVVVFVGLYRTVVDEDWLLAGLVGGAACTLRANYLVIAAVFIALALLSRRAERRSWLIAAGVAVAVLVPYWIAAYRSSGTFLFPVMEGTWNASVSLRATAASWTDELQFLIACFIESQPIVILPPVFAVIVFSTDARPTRPIVALLIASTFGFVLMVHSFVGSDSNHLWRYAFAAALTLLVVFALELGAEKGPVRIAAAGRWVLLAALVLQLVAQREGLADRFTALLAIIRDAGHARPSAAKDHAALQATAPAGARIAVMLDDAAYLDFDRNRIVHLDTPGYASPGPGLPMFAGPDALRAYFLGEGIRHVAFIRSETSRAFYRRPFWIWRIHNDAEIFQLMSAYTLDMIDSLAALATTSKVLHDAGGLVMLDLGDLPDSGDRDQRPEPERRAAYVRALADREGLHAQWSLNNRENVLFLDGTNAMAMLDAKIPVRWLHRRAHLRVLGATDMRLVARGKINVPSRPRIEVSLDGVRLASVVVDLDGAFTIDVVVPAARLGGSWRDLYVTFDGVDDPAKDTRERRVAYLESLEWERR